MGYSNIQFITNMPSSKDDPCPTCLLYKCRKYPILKKAMADHHNVWCNRNKSDYHILKAQERFHNRKEWVIIWL